MPNARVILTRTVLSLVERLPVYFTLSAGVEIVRELQYNVDWFTNMREIRRKGF